MIFLLYSLREKLYFAISLYTGTSCFLTPKKEANYRQKLPKAAKFVP